MNGIRPVPQRRRKRQRLGESTVPASRLTAERPNQVWALDFQYDQTADGTLTHGGPMNGVRPPQQAPALGRVDGAGEPAARGAPESGVGA